jgi:hypothetical protein
VTEYPSPSPPAWIHKRDGRLVPFEADKISRALFAATESLGRPDAFLARELTDGVVHFLTSESEGAVPTTAQVAELTAKVVRELGQPALAQAFADGARRRRAAGPQPAADAPLPDLVRDCVRQYALRRVFARDLAAAHGDGLLTLTGLEAPLELAGCVLGGPEAVPAAGGGPGLVEAVEETRRLAGGFVALDGPEFALARASAGPAAVPGYLRELAVGLRATGLRAVVNLNSALPPSWADDLAEGPLFAGARRPLDRHSVADLAEALRDRLLCPDPALDRVRVDWHLGDRDFRPPSAGRLLGLARAALDGAGPAFVFDRPRRPVPLAEGVDRQHPAALLTVELHLPRLAEHVPAGADPLPTFLQKLGSLARLALSAAVQKRDFLRRHSQERPAVTRGFLLDRARLVVAPVGLDAAVGALAGGPPSEGGAALEFARQVVQRLRDVLRQDGQACRLETCLDGSRLSAIGHRPSAVGQTGNGSGSSSGREPTAESRQPIGDGKAQLRLAGALHGAADLGTAVVVLDPARPPAPEQVADWLRWAWQQTDVARVRLARPAAADRQLTVPWPEERVNMTGS